MVWRGKRRIRRAARGWEYSTKANGVWYRKAERVDCSLALVLQSRFRPVPGGQRVPEILRQREHLLLLQPPPHDLHADARPVKHLRIVYTRSASALSHYPHISRSPAGKLTMPHHLLVRLPMQYEPLVHCIDLLVHPRHRHRASRVIQRVDPRRIQVVRVRPAQRSGERRGGADDRVHGPSGTSACRRRVPLCQVRGLQLALSDVVGRNLDPVGLFSGAGFFVQAGLWSGRFAREGEGRERVCVGVVAPAFSLVWFSNGSLERMTGATGVRRRLGL